MRFLTPFLAAMLIVSTVFASDVTKPVSEKAKKQILAELMASPAVRGAYAESKKWSGAKSCTKLQIEELSEGHIKVYASCDNPGDPKEAAKVGMDLSATGQFHVSAQIQEGMNKNSPLLIVIESIEFTNAG